MGNCQAIDAATLVIQHPNGKTERFYSPVSATHVMKTNPGHYVALIISTTTTTLCSSKTNNNKDNNNIANCPKKIENKKDNTINPVRITRIKLLKPTDTLQLGQVYRLITTQEVMKGLKERKKSKMKQQSMSESAQKDQDCVKEKLGLEMENAARSDSEDNLVTKPERHRTRTTTASSNNNNGGSVITTKTRFWQPSLQSISESAS